MSENALTAANDRRNTSGIEIKLDLLHTDVQDMKSVLRELTAAISRLAVVESDLNHFNAAQDRAFKVLERLEARITSLETQAVTSKQTNHWMGQAVWGAATLAVMFVISKLGMLK